MRADQRRSVSDCVFLIGLRALGLEVLGGCARGAADKHLQASDPGARVQVPKKRRGIAARGRSPYLHQAKAALCADQARQASAVTAALGTPPANPPPRPQTDVAPVRTGRRAAHRYLGHRRDQLDFPTAPARQSPLGSKLGSSIAATITSCKNV